jgi:enoyl-CoA hydratase
MKVVPVVELRNVSYEVSGGKATIMINRPERRNSLDKATYAEIQAALDEANGDPRVGVIVLTGSGEHAFASGADMKTVNTLGLDQYRDYLETNAATRTKIYGLDKPVIARVNGACLGGATSLATSCDIVVAVDSARFGQTEINVGLVGGIDHFWTLGKALVSEMMLTGRVLGAQEALQMGLINRVVARDELDAAVDEFAQKILSKSPYGIALTKRILAFSLQASGFSQARAFQFEMVLQAFQSNDRREGIEAFVERRPARYQGRADVG